MPKIQCNALLYCTLMIDTRSYYAAQARPADCMGQLIDNAGG